MIASIMTLLSYLEGAFLGLLFMLAIAIVFALPILLIYSIVGMIVYKKKDKKMYKSSIILFGVCMVFIVLFIICIAWLTDGFSHGISFM